MLSQITYMSLLGLAAAASIPRQALSSSKAFNLILKLDDPSSDLNPPVQNSFVTSIHTGAGLALVGTSPEKGRIFYQNGTQEELSSSQSTVVTDDADFPASFRLVEDESGFSTGHLVTGEGTKGVRLSEDATLLPETFLACLEPLDYYQGQEFVVIKQGESTDIPGECRAVKLIAQCTELNDLPEGVLSNHDFVLDSPCFNKA